MKKTKTQIALEAIKEIKSLDKGERIIISVYYYNNNRIIEHSIPYKWWNKYTKEQWLFKEVMSAIRKPITEEPCMPVWDYNNIENIKKVEVKVKK